MSKDFKQLDEMSIIPEEQEEEKKPKLKNDENNEKTKIKNYYALSTEDYLLLFRNGYLRSSQLVPLDAQNNYKDKREKFKKMKIKPNGNCIVFKPKENMEQEVEKVTSQPQGKTLEIINQENQEMQEIESILAQFDKKIDSDIIESRNEPMEEIQQLTDEQLLEKGLSYTINVEDLISNKDLLLIKPPERTNLLNKDTFKTISIQFKFEDGTLEFSSEQYLGNEPMKGFKWKKDDEGFYLISDDEAKKPEEQQIRHRKDISKLCQSIPKTKKEICYGNQNLIPNLKSIINQRYKDKGRGEKKSLNETCIKVNETVYPSIYKSKDETTITFKVFSNTTWIIYNQDTKYKLEELLNGEKTLQDRLNVIEKEKEEILKTIKKFEDLFEKAKIEVVDLFKNDYKDANTETIVEDISNWSTLDKEGILALFPLLNENESEIVLNEIKRQNNTFREIQENIGKQYEEIQNLQNKKLEIDNFLNKETEWSKEIYMTEKRKNTFSITLTYSESCENELKVTIKPETIEEYNILKNIFQQQIQNVIINYSEIDIFDDLYDYMEQKKEEKKNKMEEEKE